MTGRSGSAAGAPEPSRVGRLVDPELLGAIGAKLRDHRLSAHLSLVDIADRSNLTVDLIAGLERGKTDAFEALTIKDLLKLAQALGTRPAALFEGAPAAAAPR